MLDCNSVLLLRETLILIAAGMHGLCPALRLHRAGSLLALLCLHRDRSLWLCSVEKVIVGKIFSFRSKTTLELYSSFCSHTLTLIFLSTVKVKWKSNCVVSGPSGPLTICGPQDAPSWAAVKRLSPQNTSWCFGGQQYSKYTHHGREDLPSAFRTGRADAS